MDISKQISHFTQKPFRLFFLSASSIAILAAILVLMTSESNTSNFLWLQGFTAAAYTGFLFTALPKWTKYTTPLLKHTQVMWVVWLSAVIMAFYSVTLSLGIMMVYWLVMLYLITQMVVQSHDTRQISFIITLLSIIGITCWQMYQSWNKNLEEQHFLPMLNLFVIVYMLITFRIGRMMGLQALKDSGLNHRQFIPNPFYKNLQIYLLYLLIMSEWIARDIAITGCLSLGVGAVTLGRLRDWHFTALLKQHYVRYFYITLLLLGISYVFKGLVLIGILDNFNNIYYLQLSVLLLCILQKFHFASLRHCGCNIRYSFFSQLALLLLIGLCVLECIDKPYSIMTPLRNSLIVGAFLFYMLTYYRIFITDNT